ncbi:MAG: tRNA (cytidine(34)-2'-O)-methyltransferase [Chlamydiae bacterium]|nr:tRNA (cytidine(34)-2'-O)-methyltransferase [Chlamydiota bacterium]
MKVILVEPQIPQNTGNIVRTCKATNSELLLVKPLGFQVTDRALKRAGLDYWDGVNVSLLDDLPSLLQTTDCPFYFFSSHATRSYTEVSYTASSLLIFGSETTGLPSLFLETWPHLFLTIPMMKDCRCLNLANTVSIVLYEAWRQQDFRGAAL